MRRPALALAAVLLLAPLAGCLDGGLVGEPVPAFELVTNEGERVNASSYAGRYLVLDLMATWCAPCKAEVAHLREVQRLHGDRVAILSVSVEPDDSAEDMERFAAENGASWPHALDPGLKVARAMGLSIIPKLIIVDPQGIVVFEAQGEVLPAVISSVVSTGAPPPSNAWGPTAVAVGLVAGVAATLTPYRRLHRPSVPSTAYVAAGILALLAFLLPRFGGVVSPRASPVSLLLGAACLAAVPWWLRIRRRERDAPPAHAVWSAGDRLYEAAPFAALTVALSLRSSGGAWLVAPLLAFAAANLAAERLAPRVPEGWRERAGLLALAAVGAALVAAGAPLLLASA